MKINTRPKKTRAGVLVAAMNLAVFASSTQGAQQTISQGMTHHRTVDASVWAITTYDLETTQKSWNYTLGYTLVMGKKAKKGGFHPFLHPILHPLDTCAH